MLRQRCLSFVLFAALVLTAAPAAASPMVLSFSGVFNGDSSVGGVNFGVPTPFTVEATFDSSIAYFLDDGVGLFDADVITFDIDTVGTFTLNQQNLLWYVGLFSPTGIVLPNYGISIGFISSNPGYFLTAFQFATPPFDADAPVPSVLSGFLGQIFASNITLPLVGISGDGLFVDELISFGPTATISAVPEPATLLLLGVGLGTIAVRGRRKAGV